MSGANVNVSYFRPHQRPCVRACARMRAQRLAQRSQPDVTALLFITTTWWLCCCCYQSCCRPLVRLHSGAVTCNQQLILEWTWWITVVWIIRFVFQPSEASFLAIESPPFFGTSCIKSRCLFPSCVYICECKCASPQTGTAVLRREVAWGRPTGFCMDEASSFFFFFLSSSPLARVFVPTRFTLFLYSIWLWSCDS